MVEARSSLFVAGRDVNAVLAGERDSEAVAVDAASSVTRFG